MISLKAKSVQGVSWSFVESFAGSGISFFIGVILARLLEPSAFGIVGMVSILFAISTAFIDSGFTDGLIRKMSCTQQELSTIFIFNFGVSIAFYMLLYLVAPYIAVFFKEPQLILITRILGIIVIIDSLSLVQRVILIRAINFKLLTKISILTAILSGLIGLTLAYFGYGVWSLIFQVMTKQTMFGILLWAFSRWRPSIEFSVSAFKELFSFSSKLLITSLINTFQNNIFYLVIGRYFSATGLGYYTRAEQFNAILSTNLNGSLQRVFLPVFSSIQEDEDRLKTALKKVIITSFFFTFILLVVMVAIAKPFIYILIGPKWETSIIYLQLLSIGSISFPISSLNYNMLKIKGRSDIILRLQWIKVPLLLIVIFAGIWRGIAFMLIVRIFTTFIETYLNSMFSEKLFNYGIKEQLLDISPYFLPTLLIGLAMYFVSLTSLIPWLMISVQLTIGVVLFYIIFDRNRFPEYIELKKMIFKLLK